MLSHHCPKKFQHRILCQLILYRIKNINSPYLEAVNETEIKKRISSLKTNSPGYDMISITVLMWCVDYSCHMSLQEGIFPDEQKLSNVISRRNIFR